MSSNLSSSWTKTATKRQSDWRVIGSRMLIRSVGSLRSFIVDSITYFMEYTWLMGKHYVLKKRSLVRGFIYFIQFCFELCFELNLHYYSKTMFCMSFALVTISSLVSCLFLPEFRCTSLQLFAFLTAFQTFTHYFMTMLPL